MMIDPGHPVRVLTISEFIMAFLLSSERPAVAGSFSHPFAAFGRWWRMLNAKRTRRTRLEALLDMDEYRLDDLGLNRQDILEAVKQSRDGAALLTQRRAERARRRFGSGSSSRQVRS